MYAVMFALDKHDLLVLVPKYYYGDDLQRGSENGLLWGGLAMFQE